MTQTFIIAGLIFAATIYKFSLTAIYRAWITEAILEYRIDCRCNRREIDVDFSDMEPMWLTCIRFWDWGYSHILPKEKFALVKMWLQ